ncbi:MAG: hypothetical protein JXA10_08700 [Anaerolineae bacterium]|nr:hypothetical protein [Anaerolineae bacterium]
MTDETKLDNELAAFTDRLLAGQDAQSTPEIDALAQVVRQFHYLADPASGPDPAFRDRLAQRLDQEWAAIQAENQVTSVESQPVRSDRQVDSGLSDLFVPRAGSGSRRKIRNLRRNRTVWLTAIAATITVALLVAVLIDVGDESATGTASGNLDWPVVVGIVVVAFLGVLVFWLGQRSKS